MRGTEAKGTMRSLPGIQPGAKLLVEMYEIEESHQSQYNSKIAFLVSYIKWYKRSECVSYFDRFSKEYFLTFIALFKFTFIALIHMSLGLF